MNSNLEHKNWQQKLSRWLSGDANRQDELHLEKMARDDSFLADAIEGYQSLPADNHTQKVTRLKAKLRQKNQQKKGVTWMKIAAIGAFLVVALFALREYNQAINTEGTISQRTTPPTLSPNEITTSNKPDIPQTTSQENLEKGTSEEKTAPKTSDLLKDKVNSATKTIKKQLETTEIIDYTSTSETVLGQPESTEILADTPIDNTTTTYNAEPPSASAIKPDAPKVVIEESVATTMTPSPLNEAEFDKVYEPVILSADNDDRIEAAEEAIAIEADVISDNNYVGRVVKGKILSEGGEPLIGANVIITGTPAGTTTDFDGDFTLNVPDNSSIDIRLLGYNDLRVNLQHQNELEINLEESNIALESVAVTTQKASKNKAKKRSMDAEPSKEFKQETVKVAAPKMGVLKFEKYIQQNLRYPEEAKQNDVSDTVIVQFKVKKNGNLTNFKILKSVGFGCDEEAIRILKEGPKWETTIDTVLSYEIEFKNW